jgi:hypothetical protein
VEQVLAAAVAATHGVITRAELRALGLTAEEIKQRVRRGTLLREHRGVYRVGHRAPSAEATYLAAVRACGEGAVLEGRAAAWLHGLLRGPAPAPEVATPTERRVAGVATTRARRTGVIVRAVPVTTVPRTLVDLAALLGEADLARACHEAGVRHGATPGQVSAVLPRNSPGAATLQRVMTGEVRVALSRLESRFLRLLEQHDLPLPDTNRPAGGRRVDARWPARRLTVELDGYRYHRSRHAWEQDRRREREARARGDEFRRYSWADVTERPRHMLTDLRALLTPAADAARTAIPGRRGTA